MKRIKERALPQLRQGAFLIQVVRCSGASTQRLGARLVRVCGERRGRQGERSGLANGIAHEDDGGTAEPGRLRVRRDGAERARYAPLVRAARPLHDGGGRRGDVAGVNRLHPAPPERKTRL